jgi:hypothetical protein
VKTKTPGTFESVKGDLRCAKVYPRWDATTSNPLHTASTWKGDAVAFLLTKQQAEDLAAALKDASEQKETIVVTGFREPLKDGQIHVTVGGTLLPPARGVFELDEEIG